jgi:1-phosphofructokinase family hexose kinase
MEPGRVNRALEVRERASGKSVNAARVAHELGSTVRVIAPSGGWTGKQFLEELVSAGIPASLVNVRGATRVCTTILEDQQATEIVEPAPALSQAEVDELYHLAVNLLADARVLVLSGSVPPGVPPDVYARLAGNAKDAGVPVIVDATGAELLATLPSRPLVVKPNLTELAQTLGRRLESDADILAAAEEVRARGAQAVIVTRGPQPSLLVTEHGRWIVESPRVRSINPIGSGDALAGGMAHGLSSGLELMDAALLGVACAGSNVTTPLAAMIDVPLVEKIRSQLQAEQIGEAGALPEEMPRIERLP